MAVATSSLPVPLSPVISTGTFCPATRPMALYTSRMAGHVPTRSSSPVGLRGFLRDTALSLHPPGDFQGPAHHRLQLAEVDRLEEVVEGPLMHGLDGRIRRPGHGDENDRDARVDPADHPVDFQARLVGQPQVEEDHIRSLGPEAVQPRRAARRDLDPVKRCGECLPDLLRDQGGIVIDEK